MAALAADAATDSNVQTVKHERASPSQVTELPKRTIGDRVGRYLILSTLGTGGMGVVFAAYDPQLDRKVALKLLRSGLQLATKDAQKRLKREAQAIAQLSHPNVVGVYDVGTTDEGDLYIAMEFVEGETLTQWLRSYPRSWREIVDVFLQAAKGLVAAHGVGLLHRDFKPDNVLVGGDGRVRVTDFGLARSLIAIDEESGRGATPALPAALSSSLTATGTVLGTPRYMPPEQLMGPDIDARADQFSFCVALYEALYGAHPLDGNTSVTMLDKQVPATPPPETTKVPASIGRALMRGLNRDRTKRFPMMAQLMTELIPPAPKLSSRLAAFGVAGVLVATFAAAAVMYARKPPTGPASPTLEPGVTADLVQTINQLKARIRALEEERRILLKKVQEGPAQQVKELQQQLEDKDRQIHELVDKIDKLAAPQAAKLPPARLPSQALLVLNTFQDYENNLDGCFKEWTDRPDDFGHAQTDARLAVRMSVGPDGVAHSAVATGVDSPSLRWCVENALSRIPFPAGPEQVDLEVTVTYSGGDKNVSPRVVGHHPAAGTLIDLQ